MIRLFVVIGIALVSLATYLATYGQGPDFQMAPATSLFVQFQGKGLMPDANAVVENEEVEHGIFEVPDEDAAQLKMAMSNMDGMNMGGMKMEGEAAMKMEGEAAKKMPMGEEAKSPMKMEGEAAMKMEGEAAMKMEGEAAKKMPMGEEGQAAMKMEGEVAKKMPMGEEGMAEMKMGSEKAEGGLKISEEGAFDREIDLAMAEWEFSNLKLDVKSGEKIRFNITNNGKIPHEFMFMTMPAMSAINYRARRADWSLLEHEALYEKSLVLPGGKFSFVVEIQENGVWMFMCMLPYHMQMGMMGQMATPGMAMDMSNMQM